MNNDDFFSIDRLMEFGLGMAVAKQMVDVMNQSMKSMYVPGSIQSMPNTCSQQTFYVAINNQQVGPLNESELMKLIQTKQINKDTLAWYPGMTAWQPIEKVPAILRIIALTPPSLP